MIAMQDATIARTIAANVDRLRLDRQLSERQLAAAAGIPHRTVNRLVRAEGMASIVTVVRIARYFDVSVDSLTMAKKNIPQPT